MYIVGVWFISGNSISIIISQTGGVEEWRSGCHALKRVFVIVKSFLVWIYDNKVSYIERLFF